MIIDVSPRTKRSRRVTSPAKVLSIHVENLRFYLERALEEAAELQDHVGEDIAPVDAKLRKLQ
jgi:hypothetical protein